MKHTVRALRDVLEQIHNLPWGHWLYLPRDQDWTLDSECAVLDPDEIENDDDEAPRFAIEQGLRDALGVQTVQMIVANAEEQVGDPTMDELLDAFLYYYDHDAYIRIRRPSV